MKRLLILTGLLTTLFLEADSSLSIIHYPLSIQKAFAQCPATDNARELAGKTPIGHYAEAVLDRVNAGITRGKTAPVQTELTDRFNLHFLDTIASVFYMLVDTDLRAVEYHRDLTSITPCFHADLAIFEAKIEEIRCEINEAYKRKSPEGIRILKQTANFLNQRYKHLVKGGLEPAHEDLSWQYHYNFEPPFEGSCCVLDLLECQKMTSRKCKEPTDDGKGIYDFYPTHDECLTESICVATDGDPIDNPEYEVICPFDSNYLEFGSSGYGCAISVYEDFASGSAQSGVQKEAEAAEELAETHETFVDDIEHIKDTTLTMDEMVDETMLNDNERNQLDRFGDTVDADLRRVYGCNADLKPEDRENLDNTEGDLTPGIKPSEEWTAIPLRGDFFFHKNHLGIWKKFFRLQHHWASTREFPTYMREPDEFFEEEDRKKAAERDNTSFGLITVPRNHSRSALREFMLEQATADASILPKAQDLSRQVVEVLEPVRPSTKRNIELVTDVTEGLRKFGKNYAYYLRRSCIYRPCNNRLDQILKIFFVDDCFPYASGDFENGVEPNPEFESCMEDVGDADFCESLHEPFIGDPYWKKCKDGVDEL